jgi:hypothetical protein
MKIKYFLFLLLFSGFVFSQEEAWVYFNDKPNAQFYLDNPIQMLSQRALDRRQNQGISIVLNDAPIHQTYIDQINAAQGIVVKAKSKWMNCVHVRGSITDINALTNLPFVHHVQFANRTLNQQGKMARRQKIKRVAKKWNTQTNFNYGTSNVQIQMLNGHLLHQQNFTGAGKIIAVMDAGFPNVDLSPTFQRSRDNNLILGGYNFVNRNTTIYSNNNHGSMVLSTMAGYIENQLIGTAPDAAYYLFITEDTNSETPLEESNWVEAAELADSLGVDIINTSLGYFTYDNPNYSYTYEDMNGTTSFIAKGADIAFSKGMICVTSAGNSGNTNVPTISTPADAVHTLTIGAVAFDESYASFSSIGPSFDNRIKPDVMAQGQNPFVSTTTGSITNSASGTSFSSPIMAGMVASFWQAIPWATNAQVIQFIKQASDRFSNPTSQFGYGIPDFQMALNMAQLSLDENISCVYKVVPNPTNDVFHILLPNETNEVAIVVYTMLGQKVFEKKHYRSQEMISLENNNAGIYFYTIEGQNIRQSGKIIKN